VTDPLLEHWAEDIVCLRLPMPAFGGVNAFILGKPGQRVIVDSGMPGPETAALWRCVLDDTALGPVVGLLCTHAHIDHVGQVELLTQEAGAPLFMSAEEYQDVSIAVGMSLAERSLIADAYHDRGGFPQARRAQPTDYSVLAPFPQPTTFLEDGDRVSLGGIEWEVLVNGGHSRAAICLLSTERKLLLAGDQLLTGSGPQVPVQAERPEDDPLGAYFRFLDRLDTLPDDLIVFPGHGAPIHEFKAQVARIRTGHLQRIDRLLKSLSGTMTCAELARLVFPNPSPRLRARLPYLIQAIVNYLVARSELRHCTELKTTKYWKK